METKQFSLNTVASVITGRVLTSPKSDDDNGISDIYEILSWMTDDEVYTHQIPRFMSECKPYLLKQYPSLSACISQLHILDNLLPAAKRGGGAQVAVDHYITWLRGEIELLPFYDVAKIPQDDHTKKDPVEEMAKGKKIIVINPEADE